MISRAYYDCMEEYERCNPAAYMTREEVSGRNAAAIAAAAAFKNGRVIKDASFFGMSHDDIIRIAFSYSVSRYYPAVYSVTINSRWTRPMTKEELNHKRVHEALRRLRAEALILRLRQR